MVSARSGWLPAINCAPSCRKCRMEGSSLASITRSTVAPHPAETMAMERARIAGNRCEIGAADSESVGGPGQAYAAARRKGLERQARQARLDRGTGPKERLCPPGASDIFNARLPMRARLLTASLSVSISQTVPVSGLRTKAFGAEGCATISEGSASSGICLRSRKRSRSTTPTLRPARFATRQ